MEETACAEMIPRNQPILYVVYLAFLYVVYYWYFSCLKGRHQLKMQSLQIKYNVTGFSINSLNSNYGQKLNRFFEYANNARDIARVLYRSGCTCPEPENSS